MSDKLTDDELRGLAMAAFDEHERGVGAAETEAALVAVRERINAGDTGNVTALAPKHGEAKRPWAMLGAAAAVVALVGVGVVAVVASDDSDDVLTPGTNPPATTIELPQTTVPAPATTVAVPDSTVAPNTTVVPTTTVAPDPAVAPIVVPAVEGVTLGAAVNTLNSVGLVPETELQVVEADSPNDGRVISQRPAPGASVPNGTTVTIVVGQAVEPANTLPAQSIDPAALAIPDNCIGDFNCTRLAATESGSIVAYDPTTETLTIYDPTGMTVLASVPLAEPLSDASPGLVHVGPDDVAYVSVQTPGTVDPSRDILTIPLLGPNAGTVIGRVTGADGTGDTDLVPGQRGLVTQSCCSGAIRPAPDAEPFVDYVDRNGNPINSLVPTFSLSGEGGLGNLGGTLTMNDVDAGPITFRLPTAVNGYRGMPHIIATDDGGALLVMYSDLYQRSFLVDFNTDWSASGIDPADVYFTNDAFGLGPVLLERSGTVIVRDEQGNFLRRSLDEVADPGWGGSLDIDLDSGAVTAPGFNDHIDANTPAWASDATAFGLALNSSAGPNEVVDIDLDEASGVLTITTTGLLDDSAQATRVTIQTERNSAGLLQFVSGTYGFQCAVGRGHQDFSLEPCI